MKRKRDENQIGLFSESRPTLLDAKATREAAEDGMHRATFLTDHEEKHERYQTGCNVARRMEQFTVDEIWDEIGVVGTDRDDGSGIGPTMKELYQDGIIEPARDSNGKTMFRKSRRPPTHGRPLTVWKSRIFKRAS